MFNTVNNQILPTLARHQNWGATTGKSTVAVKENRSVKGEEFAVEMARATATIVAPRAPMAAGLQVTTGGQWWSHPAYAKVRSN
jgi:hypothetical protein